MFDKLRVGVLIVVVAGLLSACGGGNKQVAVSASQAASNALQSKIYQSVHNVEFRNYNLRQKITDDPSTILWCTFFPGTVGQEPFTVPIAGKLTSSNKRPYSDVGYIDAGNYSWYQKQVPSPDHMFGSSAEYRYGFDPTLAIYYDFTSLPSFCTNAPLIWQQNQTRIVVATAPTLASIGRAAQAAIRSGNAAKALSLLKTAESPK